MRDCQQLFIADHYESGNDVFSAQLVRLMNTTQTFGNFAQGEHRRLRDQGIPQSGHLCCQPSNGRVG